RVERQVVLPGLERLARDERRDPGDGRRVPDDELLLLAEPGGRQELRPVEPRSGRRQRLAGAVVVRLLDVGRVLAAAVDLGDLALELEDPRALGRGVRDLPE